MISYEYTISSTAENLSIVFDNLHLSKSQFYHSDFIIIEVGSKILNFLLNVSNSVIESKFFNSSLIKESIMTN